MDDGDVERGIIRGAAAAIEAAATREETRASTATIVIDLESRKRIDRECGRRDVKWVRL